jgi:pimeloyl-ACP methyl ester carboxylesterase
MTVLRWVRYLWVRAGVLVLIASPAVMYVMFRAQGLPPETFATTASLRVTESDYYVRFAPAQAGTAAWMLLPGCPADPHAYAPLARAVAEQGVLSVIVKVPYRCAPWPQHQAALRQRVLGIIDSCVDCAWTLAGHSRGARHALELTRSLPAGRVASIVLMGSTHPREESYASLGIPVLKILASEDGVAPPDDALAHRDLLPASARWEVIDGGNHAQFGYYGYQLWDHPAKISREQQHQQVAALLLGALNPRSAR